MKILMNTVQFCKNILYVINKSTHKKFLKYRKLSIHLRESIMSPNEQKRHNICFIEIRPNIRDVS